jgi:hypothetical protein
MGAKSASEALVYAAKKLTTFANEITDNGAAEQLNSAR